MLYIFLFLITAVGKDLGEGEKGNLSHNTMLYIISFSYNCSQGFG